MFAEDTTQLGTILRPAKIDVVFAGTLKDLLVNGYPKCSSYPKGILHNSQYICHKLEIIPPKNMTRLNKNVSEYLHCFIGLKPPLWLSDLCAALITVSALFLIHLICVLHLSALVHSVHNNQLAQVFHSEVTKLLAFLDDYFKIGKLSIAVHNFCLCVTRQNIEEEIMSTPNLPGPSAYDNDFDIDKMLEDHE
jgi:hypothetical protein